MRNIETTAMEYEAVDDARHAVARALFERLEHFAGIGIEPYDWVAVERFGRMFWIKSSTASTPTDRVQLKTVYGPDWSINYSIGVQKIRFWVRNTPAMERDYVLIMMADEDG